MAFVHHLGIPPCFSANFTKGDNFRGFLLASRNLFKMGLTHQGKNLLIWENFLQDLTQGDESENGRVAAFEPCTFASNCRAPVGVLRIIQR